MVSRPRSYPASCRGPDAQATPPGCSPGVVSPSPHRASTAPRGVVRDERSGTRTSADSIGVFDDATDIPLHTTRRAAVTVMDCP